MPYLDHAATTPLHPDVLEAMLPWLQGGFGNASSLHRDGRRARGAVEDARRRIARHLNAEPAQIVFTSGGTEADNLALRGTVGRGQALVTSEAEHEAVLKTADALEADGRTVVRLRPDDAGAVSPALLARTLAAMPRVALLSLMHANNETGVLADLPALAAAAHDAGALFHTDAVQSAGLLPIDVQALGVDLLTASAHKFYGPKGVGLLYVAPGVDLDPLVTGGAQERGRRGGTENVAGIVGMAHALDLAAARRDETNARLLALRLRLLDRLTEALGGRFVLNTPLHRSIPSVLNLAFPPNPSPLDAEMLILGLDLEGVSASAGSACTSGALTPSHVLLALGLPRETAAAAVRFSLGSSTTEADVDTAADALVRVLARVDR
ncbi:MAG: cysteine desulfurase [Rhodothermales bacterium]|nr:cysteine desulfurase [Rhodothermales bacterium]